VVQRLATSPARVSTKARHGGSQCTVAPSARLPGVTTAPSEGHAAQGGRQAGGTSAPRQRASPRPPPPPGVAAAGSSMEDWEEGFFSGGGLPVYPRVSVGHGYGQRFLPAGRLAGGQKLEARAHFRAGKRRTRTYPTRCHPYTLMSKETIVAFLTKL
jgi:hypothetical protein